MSNSPLADAAAAYRGMCLLSSTESDWEEAAGELAWKMAELVLEEPQWGGCLHAELVVDEQIIEEWERSGQRYKRVQLNARCPACDLIVYGRVAVKSAVG